MGGTNGSGELGTLLAQALADEERRLEALEARLAALRGGAAVVETPASESTRAIWVSLAERAPAAAPEPEPAPDEPAPEPVSIEDDDADDWAALAAHLDPAEEALEEPAAPPDAPEDDPRLEAARRLLAESGQGLQQLRACLARAPGWGEAPPSEPAPPAEDEPDEGAFWSDDDDDAPAPRAEPPVRERAPAPRPREVEPARFGLERAFRADGQEPAWAQALRERQGQELDVLQRVEELLIELGKTVAAVLERARPAPELAEAEARAARAEQERDALRAEVAARAARIARLEALVEQVLSAAPAAPSPPPPPATVTPRGTRRPTPPSEALRRALLSSPAASSSTSRLAVDALRPAATDDERAALRRDLLASGARQRQLGDEQASLLERLARLL
ncbi:MAG: hypothetical protein M9894_27275 [Planctomycetes bacterium]|nr:hypothetical protein [Planctomycetota bacterium]